MRRAAGAARLRVQAIGDVLVLLVADARVAPELGYIRLWARHPSQCRWASTRTYLTFLPRLTGHAHPGLQLVQNVSDLGI